MATLIQRRIQDLGRAFVSEYGGQKSHIEIQGQSSGGKLGDFVPQKLMKLKGRGCRSVWGQKWVQGQSSVMELGDFCSPEAGCVPQKQVRMKLEARRTLKESKAAFCQPSVRYRQQFCMVT